MRGCCNSQINKFLFWAIVVESWDFYYFGCFLGWAGGELVVVFVGFCWLVFGWFVVLLFLLVNVMWAI